MFVARQVGGLQLGHEPGQDVSKLADAKRCDVVWVRT